MRAWVIRNALVRWVAAIALVSCVVAAAYLAAGLARQPAPPAQPVPLPQAGAALSAGSAPAASGAMPQRAGPAEPPPVAAAGAASTPDPGPPSSGRTFAVDASGRLVRNEQTRLNVEALVALTPPEQLRAAAQAQVQDLPAAAAAEAVDLVERYGAYQAAQKQSFPPGQAPLVPEEALAELDGLHALRVSYFGREGAQSLFGQEEAIARQLLEWMRDDKAPGLSMEQRAMRAQARYDAARASAPPR
jgi:hypothetical protein